MNLDEKLAIAEVKAAKAVEYRNRLVVIRRAEAEIPELHDTGEVTMSALAKTYGISHATVKRILRDAGRQDTRFKKLSADERAEVAALIRQGRDHDHLAATYQVSRNTIRRIGLAAGAITPGRRKSRRSDEEYGLIAEFDAEARSRFNGAGLYNLGMGLRQWQRRQAGAADALKSAEAFRARQLEREQDEAPDPREEPEGVALPGADHRLPPAQDAGDAINDGEDTPWLAADESPEPDESLAPEVGSDNSLKPSWQI